MSQAQLNPGASAQTQDDHWRGLYKIGAVAALISVVIIPLSIVAFFCDRRSWTTSW